VPGGEGCSTLDQRTPATLYLSADDSNSTASPVIVRRLIRAGQPVAARFVRPWEFLNYYDFSFEPAPPGDVRITAQLASCTAAGALSFQVALTGEHRSQDERRPLNVTFVLDSSGAMSGEPIARERAAVLALAHRLRAGDVVSMVTWSTTQVDILSGHVITGPDDPSVVSAAAQLEAGGGTDLNAGLSRGYRLAEQYYQADRINRVVLISDGQANAGVTDIGLIASHADDEEGQEGIYLAGIGVGDGVNDTLMNAVTDAGRGAYVYLDSDAETEKMLGDRFLQVVDVAARAVRLELTLPWYLQVTRFSGEAISVDPAKVRPQHLSPNDSMFFFQVLRACDPSLVHGDDHIRMRATWQTPVSRVNREAVFDATLNGLAGDDGRLKKGAAIAAYAQSLIDAARASGAEAKRAALQSALSLVDDAMIGANDPDLVEIEGLLHAYLGSIL
jgi:Ca-activated chloride channel family protein